MTDEHENDDLKTLDAEIDSGVDDIVEAVTAGREASTAADEASTKEDETTTQAESGDSGKGSDDTQGGDDAPGEGDDGDDAVTDEHLERAVKAGLTMAEARKFGSAELLDAMVSRLEAAGTSSDLDGDDDDVTGEGEGDGKDPLDAIPDLDPEEYDEKIVDAFKGMKGIIRGQQKMIESLKQPATSEDWLKVQVSGMDEAVSAAIKSDPAKLDAVREKFDVLEAGYKAAKKDVTREDIVQEAVNITLGDEIRSGKLGKRKTQHISRPAGHRATPKGDPLEEVGDEVDRKYFQNT